MADRRSAAPAAPPAAASSGSGVGATHSREVSGGGDVGSGSGGLSSAAASKAAVAATPAGMTMQSTDKEAKSDSVVVKVGMVGDPQVGKTSLMVRYVEGKFDEDYIETLGVNFMEKTVELPKMEVVFSIWDLGGAREFVPMLPLVCNDALAILFMFDLTRMSTLLNIKQWYAQVRGLNKTAVHFLVGLKYDLFVKLPAEEQEAITTKARSYAKTMQASLVFTSASHGINITKMFKLVFCRVFNVAAKIPQQSAMGDPILEY